MKTLPGGTAYAVWTGTGAVGVAILGIFLFNESREIARIFSIVLIVAGVVGLKVFRGRHRLESLTGQSRRRTFRKLRYGTHCYYGFSFKSDRRARQRSGDEAMRIAVPNPPLSSDLETHRLPVLQM